MKAKRIVALVLVGIMVFGLCATAFATRPSASLSSKYKNQYIKLGKSWKPVFKVKSNSYAKKSGTYRAKFYSVIFYDHWYYGIIPVSELEKKFTGNKEIKAEWKVKASQYCTGTYLDVYGTYYRSNKYSSWREGKFNSTYIYVY